MTSGLHKPTRRRPRGHSVSPFSGQYVRDPQLDDEDPRYFVEADNPFRTVPTGKDWTPVNDSKRQAA